MAVSSQPQKIKTSWFCYPSPNRGRLSLEGLAVPCLTCFQLHSIYHSKATDVSIQSNLPWDSPAAYSFVISCGVSCRRKKYSKTEQTVLESREAERHTACARVIKWVKNITASSWFGGRCASPGNKFGSYNRAASGHQGLCEGDAEREETFQHNTYSL